MKNKIYIKQWLALKPRNYSGSTDLYYLKIANKIKSSLAETEVMMLSRLLDDDKINDLCCFLTCYFEDVVSEVNIWGAFKSEYAKLYDKKLPFFEIDDDYIDEEINLLDVVFLMWYYINALQDHMFISPFNTILFDIAASVMLEFDEEYEFAPENVQLKKCYHFEVRNDDNTFYETRTFIQHVFFESYLFQPDIKKRLDNSVFNLIEDNKGEDPEMVMGFMRSITEDYAFNQHSKLLALTAKEWSCAILGNSTEESKDVSTLSKKIQGFFLFKKQDEASVYLEHIASGLPFEMTKKSFDHANELSKDDIIYIGLVNYKNEWWFSGNYIKKGFDADLILDERNSATSRAEVNFLSDKKEVKNVLELQKQAFLKFNDNALIAVIPSIEVENFVNNYMSFYNDSLQLSDVEISEATKRTRADGYFDNKSVFNEFDEDKEATIIFFNQNQGIEFYVDVIGAFPGKNNPFFEKEIKEDVQHILMSDNCSTEFANYLVDNYKDRLEYFETEPYKSYLNDLDFLLRFWKHGNYHTESNVVMTGG